MNHTNPKVKFLKKVSNIRPIGLCDVLYKIISKLLANRLQPFLNDILSINQSVFTPRRLITDNAIIGRSKKTIFAHLRDRVWKKVQGWKENLFSSPRREIMIKAVTQSIPTKQA